MLRSAAIALAALFACSCTREKLGGIEVTLRFEPTSTAQCAKVYVTGEDNRTQKPTEPMPRQMRDLHIGIQQSADLGSNVTIEAHGYDTTDCTGPWTDDSNVVQKSFVMGTVVSDVLLILDGRPITNSDGGVEICDNGVDDDADTQADCKDFDCDGKSCGAPNRCVNFICQAATSEVNCTDGVDDDNNGKIDCADDACATKSCVSTNACLLNKRCLAGVCGGDAVTCTAPAICQMPGSGMCLSDGGCGYTDRTGPCGDGGTCTAGACTLSFPFTPHNVPKEIPEAELNGDLTINCATSLDTDTGQWANLCIGQAPPRSFLVNQPGGAPVLRVIALRSLQVTASGTITLAGTKPVAFAVLGDANVSGTIAANANGGTDGAGSPGSSCGTSAGSPAVVATTAGGGGAGHGGQGERGGDGNQMSASGGNRGSQSSDNDLSPLRGGCSGGLGAVPLVGAVAASGGGGGGAFQLTVGGTLNVTGHLLANGAGGRGGPLGKGGGGGGGSGGGILLEATSTTLAGNARVLTNGGAGGAGAVGNTAGDPGQDGHPDDANRATGGSGPGEPGGDAQDPGNAAQRGSDAQSGSAAAGGGGSGMGRVVVFGTCTQTSGVLSSPAVPNGMCNNI